MLALQSRIARFAPAAIAVALHHFGSGERRFHLLDGNGRSARIDPLAACLCWSFAEKMN